MAKVREREETMGVTAHYNLLVKMQIYRNAVGSSAGPETWDFCPGGETSELLAEVTALDHSGSHQLPLWLRIQGQES